jgi:hypothetical protein
MGDSQFIHSRSGALFSVAFTGFLTYQTLRGVLHYRIPHSMWVFIPLPLLPNWMNIALNVLVYASIAWLCVAVFGMGGGKERLILAGWSVTLLLGLIQPFVPQEIAISIQYLKGLAISVAFLMSVLIAFSFFLPVEAESSD